MSKGALYNITARGYDQLHQEEQERKLKTVLSNIKVESSHWLLDVGCGTCISFPFFDCHYKFGIDPSIELLKYSKPHRNSKGKVINSQGESLPFRSNLFDIVICMTAIHNFDNIELGIKEIKRVAKDDSVIVITVLKKVKMASQIVELIKENLNILSEIDDYHDHIFICNK